jgi:hypothetical protein
VNSESCAYIDNPYTLDPFLSGFHRYTLHLSTHLSATNTSLIPHPFQFQRKGIPNLPKMTGPPNKRQKREDYQKAQQAAHHGGQMELPKKKFYRQRAHANPFSDHNLT